MRFVVMSENRSRFRIRKGDVEIEYEGKSKEVSMRYEEAFEWIKTQTIITPKLEPARKLKEEKPKKKRGGRRTGIISPAIDKLIKEGFFDNFKNSTQVLEELRRKTVPVSGIEPVITALNRKVPKKLDRIKDKEGRWVYRKTQGSNGG